MGAAKPADAEYESVCLVELADAEIAFKALVERAEAGETIGIVRDGRQVAQLSPKTPRKPVDLEWFRSVTDGMTMQEEDGGTFMRRLRDDARY